MERGPIDFFQQCCDDVAVMTVFVIFDRSFCQAGRPSVLT